MKNALKLFLEFWKLYFAGALAVIVFLPRILLYGIMLMLPGLPVIWIYWLYSRNAMVSNEGSLIGGFIFLGVLYYFSEHTRWGIWTKKVFPLEHFNDD